MIGACEVVAQGLRAVAAHKDRTGVADAVKVREGVVHHQLQMFRSDLVGNVNGYPKVLSDDDLAVVINGCPGDLRSGKHGYLRLKLAAYVFGKEGLGFDVEPDWCEPRYDIIQSIITHSPEALCAICRGIQAGSPIDSHVVPEPWAMPGYSDPVIMAAGAFTMGASIELSADAPLREPYAAYMQGGLNYHSGKIGVLLAAQSMLEKGSFAL